jgi:hypothetical protein
MSDFVTAAWQAAAFSSPPCKPGRRGFTPFLRPARQGEGVSDG